MVEPIHVDAWAESQPQEAWQKIEVRLGTKDPVAYEYLTTRIWVYDQEYWHQAMSILFVRRDPATKSDYKYSLSNASENTSLIRLAFMQANVTG